MSTLRIALAQINPTVGDLPGNAESIRLRVREARAAGAHLVAFPELAVCGYPPEDLLLKPAFISAARRHVVELAREAPDLVAVVGFPERGDDLFNAAAVLFGGEIVGVYRKQRLPNYGVFDEMRYFRPGANELLLSIAGATVGLTICEDIWFPGGPVARQALAGADIIVNINASPYHRGKWRERHRLLGARAADYGVVIAYVNQVGGQDELVFDGNSVVFDAEGALLAESPSFAEHLLVCDIDVEHVFRARLHDPRRRRLRGPDLRSFTRLDLKVEPGSRSDAPRRLQPLPHDELSEIYQALVLGTRDYLRKNGFTHAVIGISGGIDSALVAAVAVDALGAAAVTGATMPSRFSSAETQADAAALASNLGIDLLRLPIEPAFEAVLQILEGCFTGRPADVTEENIQARVRGILLMALSNKFGWLVLTTGNKSEMATGYATLYGDMAGGLAVLKDVPKTLVYQLARWRNRKAGRPLIPDAVLTRPPTAELRPYQKDSDSLPPYEILDPILERYVEQDWTLGELVEDGNDPAVARRVISLVDRSEYKRRQAPPGIKITPRAFGKDRRLPLTSRFGGDAG